jgi:hypothetical protein
LLVDKKLIVDIENDIL